MSTGHRNSLMNGCARKSARHIYDSGMHACNSFLSFSPPPSWSSFCRNWYFIVRENLCGDQTALTKRDQLGLSFAAAFPLFGPQTRKPYRCRFNFMNFFLLLADRLKEGNEQVSKQASGQVSCRNSQTVNCQPSTGSKRQRRLVALFVKVKQ